jgi:hypothetical protein
MRFNVQNSLLWKPYAERIDAAADKSVVRAILRDLQSDPAAYHGITHALNEYARARIRALAAAPAPSAEKTGKSRK